MPVSYRRAARFFVAGVLHYGGVFRMWRFFRRKVLRRREICILGLHRVLTSEERSQANSLPAMIVTDETWRCLLEYLQGRFRLISLDTFLRGGEAGNVQEKPCCLVTFDDGWRDTFSTAYPALRKFEAPTTVFVTTGVVGTENGFWVEQLRRTGIPAALRAAMPSELAREPTEENILEWLKHMPAERRARLLQEMPHPEDSRAGRGGTDPMLTWSEVAEMSRNGVEVGAHTVSHPLLSYEDDTAVRRELVECKRMLEDKVDKPVRAFAYPNGDWNDRVRRQVQSAGYSCAFTTRPGWFRPGDDPYTVPRILLHESNITGLKGRFSPAMLEMTLTGWR